MFNLKTMNKLAIFDLDNTLLNGDSDRNWGLFLAEKNIVDDSYLRESEKFYDCLLYTSPSPRDVEESRMPSSA